MRRLMMLAAALTTALAAVPAGASDPVEDALYQADEAAYNTYRSVDRVVGDTSEIFDVEQPGNPPAVRTLNPNVDGVWIYDFGAGPIFEYRGAFNPALRLWDCTSRSGGEFYPVTVECRARPGIAWQCGEMVATAEALSRPVYAYTWARDWARGNSDMDKLPDPSRIEWGAVAAMVKCDQDTIRTPQANQSRPVTTANKHMGAVHTFLCQAQLGTWNEVRPQRPYKVICADPPNPARSIG